MEYRHNLLVSWRLISSCCGGYVAKCLILFFSLFLFTSLTHSLEEKRDILIVKSSDAKVYDEVIDHIKGSLQSDCLNQNRKCEKFKFQSIITGDHTSRDKGFKLIIALGTKAVQFTDRYFANINRINAMIPSGLAGHTKFTDNHRQSRTLLLDQPIPRNLSLIRRLIPSARHIGVLLSRSNENLNHQLAQDTEDAGFILHTKFVENESDIGRKLSPLLAKVDALLALPDTKIHNRKTVTNILLSSYRKNVPLFGFSATYVRAGAIAAVYSTPEDIGQHIAETIDEYFKSGIPKNNIVYPKYYSVSINTQVARSLDIKIPADAEEIEILIREIAK